MFDGKHGADVAKFFFVYKNVVMSGNSDEEEAGELLCYLQAEAFEYYDATYSQNGGLNATASDYQAVKKALLDRFESVPEPEENIRLAVPSRLDANDLSLGSTRWIATSRKRRSTANPYSAYFEVLSWSTSTCRSSSCIGHLRRTRVSRSP